MADAKRPRNVLCIVTDQQRQDSLSTYGNELVETPAADRLAAEGVRFDRAYTPTAICSPARASLVTGAMPFRHDFISNAGKSWGSRSDLSSVFDCLPLLLREAGYNVGLVGKWHLGQPPEAFGYDGDHYAGWAPPTDHERYREYLADNDLPAYDESALRDELTVPQTGKRISAVDNRPPEATFTAFLAERTIEMLESYAEDAPETPFHLNTHFFGPHNPYVLPKEYHDLVDPAAVDLPESAIKETFEDKPPVHRTQLEQFGVQSLPVPAWRQIIARYHGFVRLVDDQVGRILDALDRLGLAENTLVVFTSDHGGFVTSHKFQDKGPAMYEDIYNVPFVVRGIGEQGSTCDSFVSLLDLVPTTLDLADRPVPETCDGRSLLDLVDGTGDGEWREAITVEFHGHLFPYSQRMLRTDRHKLIVNPIGTDELYDLEVDPHELDNRIDSRDYESVREDLVEQLRARLESIGDTDFLPNLP